MTWIDGLVLALLALSALVGFSRGFLREALTIGAWLGAAYFAYVSRGLTAPLVEQIALDPAWIGEWASIGVVFLIALLVLRLVVSWLVEIVSFGPLVAIDRVLGLGFGALRGAALLVAAYIAAGVLLPAVDRWPAALRDSASLPRVAGAAAWAVAQVPDEVRPRLPALGAQPGPTQLELLRPQAEPRR
jgi:membrane protein required for colicin V production